MAYLNLTQFDTHTIPIQLPFAVLFSAELSSIFLGLTQYCGKNKSWENINRLCFISTFRVVIPFHVEYDVSVFEPYKII